MLGTLVSLIVLAVVIPYGFNKFFIMKEHSDTSFQSIEVENAIDFREEFSFEQIHTNVLFYFKKFQGRYLTAADIEGYITMIAFQGT